MVDIGTKSETAREAVATGVVWMQPETLALVRAGGMAKGDVLAVAQVAGVMAAKQTPQIIPMCHTLLLTGVDLAFELREAAASEAAQESQVSAPDTDGFVSLACIAIRATVRTVGRTGAEMEALTAVSAAALTIYDMCKAVDRAMVLSDIHLQRKSGGKSGLYERK
ncbi:MAG: cyclic pyranopterin monophosphate synthase MoaC, partial [Ktedonobacterales bacterium]